ncbi:Clavaminate synthase-like protein [Hanseniaspora valbyensis NRRL Y-1626]|uniref:Clavaminate synthase-like protein n=1 Tax=Hanseniaspora valbyensis NRRL Y-1626 TaxID=766949 RepID=A0A1B7TKD1_9ASCO|nr:Clavaminate synthase-like protein [Hanseniaspora valbyensis NRRL Y-1626]
MEESLKKQKVEITPDLTVPLPNIKSRTPVKFHYEPKFVQKLKASNIEQTFKTKHDELLLVEKLVAGGFGSGKQRYKMTFEEFFKRLDNGEQLYLSTQYLMDDPDSNLGEFEGEEEEEDEDEGEGFGDNPDLVKGLGSDFEDDYVEDEEQDLDDNDDDEEEEESETVDEMIMRVEDIFQRPMTKLVKELPLEFSFTKDLILQQVNLWIGSTTKLIKHKDQDFLDFDTLGKKIPEGFTSTGLHHDHADNIYIPVEGHKRFTLFPPFVAENLYTVGNINKIYDNGVIDYKMDAQAPNWISVNANGSQLPDLKPFNQGKINHKVDPPSFSKINPIFLHLEEIEDAQVREKLYAKGKELFPKFFEHDILSKRIIIDLKPGDVLFLPAGWFHEVSSRGDYHIACNYWFVPPDQFDEEKIYKDDLIYEIDSLNKKAIDFFKIMDEE